jgi:hypothetical protein
MLNRLMCVICRVVDAAGAATIVTAVKSLVLPWFDSIGKVIPLDVMSW